MESLYENRVIDNRSVRMDEALSELLCKATRLDMAVGYFYISGFELIRKAFRSMIEKPESNVCILMGNETNVLTSEVLTSGIKPMEMVLKDIEEQAIQNKEQFEEFAQWMREGKIQVRIYTGKANYFHAKSYLLQRDEYGHEGYVIVGSSNFSRSGLTANTELNTMSQDNYRALRRWFTEIWNSSEVTDFSPELLRVINQKILHDENEQYLPARLTYLEFARQYAKPPLKLSNAEYLKDLYPHQKNGVSEIFNRLKVYGTALLCDGVGLGKTRTAAATIRELGMPKTLIVVSSKLKLQWEDELGSVGIFAKDVRFISKEMIARMSAVELREFSQYELIVIDEAHQGLKSGGSKLYRNIEYIQKNAKHHILGLLLTATPWNNSRRDIFYLGRLFLNTSQISPSRPYAEYIRYASKKAAIAFEANDEAFQAFWEDLYLQRTRKTYGGKEVTFAKREFPTVEVVYEPGKQNAFEANYERISKLRLPYMNPLRYLGGQDDEFASDRLKLLFLKRADSSWRAFESTLINIEDKLKQLLSDLKDIQLHENEITKRFHLWISDSYGLIDRYDDLLGMAGIDLQEDLTDFELASRENKQRYVRRLEERINTIDKRKAIKLIALLIRDAESDLNDLESIHLDFSGAFNRKDEKYEVVRNTLKNKLESGEKVLLITQFRDTALDYFNKFVKDPILKGIRIGLVTGLQDDSTIGLGITKHTKEEILKRFSPRSKKVHEYIGSEDELDVVIGTETLSVGQNLQDARILMNLDLPYNPMVLEQRIGRIDRPRSNGQVHVVEIYTFPSMPVIEAELKMTERLRKKIEGVIKDTRFDDLVLPEYEEFLKRVLKERSGTGSAVGEMVNKAVEKQTVPVEAKTHSAEYVLAQSRLWKILQSSSQLIMPNKVIDESASYKNGGAKVGIIKTELRDVNGNHIQTIKAPFVLDDQPFEDFIEVERHWYRALNGYARNTRDLPKEKAKSAKKDLQPILEEINKRRIEEHNQRIKVVKEIEERIVETKSKQVAASIVSEVKGNNRSQILECLKRVNFSPKDVKPLAQAIEYINSRDPQFQDVLDLHQNIKLLWNDFAYYYDRFIGEHNDLNINNNSVTKSNSSGRIAVLENSTTILEIGHIAVSKV